MNIFFLALFGAVLICLFFLWPARRAPELCAPFWGVNFAHRGLHTKDKKVPENSMAAFEAAACAGYGIELDIRLSKDGEVVVFHDDDLQRVCGQPGRVDAYTLQELQNFALHGTRQTIPLLSQVLQLVNGRVPLLIELKMGPANQQLCEKAMQLLTPYQGPYCIESFDPRIVRWFKKNHKQVLRGQLAASPKALGNGISGFLVGTLLCNFLGRPHFIAYGKGPTPLTVPIVQSGAMRVVWTVRDTDNHETFENENDAVIFEFYTPKPRYKQPPPPPAAKEER